MREVVGSTIGAHEVVSELGRGGMGVVYLARDTRLDRKVAIKALPPEFASDAERLARFRREAKALALLNHPNVAQVYGLEEPAGAGAHYLVMEYVEGETLASVLKRGPVAVDEAVRLAAQVAAGVEAAHEQGIIHRDLKPGNVIVTPDGRAKVLDFGLAREVQSRGTSVDLSRSPTVSVMSDGSNPTQAGQVMGTAAYMSPEQSRGRALDRRTDIWSFGCVLFEMLTGKGPFARETMSDSIAAILEREADWSKLPARTPVRVRELLARCLEKDASKRLRDIGDARLELEKCLADREWSTTSMGAATGRVYRRRALWPTLALFGCVALGAVGALVLKGWRWPVPAVDGVRGHDAGAAAPSAMARARFTRITDLPGPELFPSLSPDGNTMVFVAGTDQTDIFQIRVGGLNPVNLTPDSPGDDTQPAYSPDGQWIAFRSDRDGGGLYVMGATGESPRRVCDNGFNPAWSPDGKQLVCATESIAQGGTRLTLSTLWVIDVATGEKRKVMDKDAVQPSWSPDGGRLAYWSTVLGGQRDLFTVSVSGGEPTAVTSDAPTDWNPVWSRDGKSLYFCSDRAGVMSVWRIGIDQATGRPTSEPEPITAGGAESAGQVSLSASGRQLAYASVNSRTQAWRAPFDPVKGELKGPPELVTRGLYLVSQARISPDGKWIAHTTGRSRAREDIFVISADGSQRRQVTNDPAKDRGPSWSPDGKRIAMYSDRDGAAYGIWVVNADGGSPRRVSPPGERATLALWSPKGDVIVCQMGEVTGAHLALLDASKPAEEQAPRRLVQRESPSPSIYPIAWSPDGQRLLCAGELRGKYEILDIASGEAREIGLRSGTTAAWLPDGHRMIGMSEQGLVIIDSEAMGAAPKLVLPGDDLADTLSISADGSWICFGRSSFEADIWAIDLEPER